MNETFAPVDPPVTLTYLKWHWGSAYRIGYAFGTWSARRQDNRDVLTATSGRELLTKIRLDYLREKVPRQESQENDLGIRMES